MKDTFIILSVLLAFTSISTVSAANLTITPISQRNLEQEAKNKQIVIDFYQELIGDNDISAIDKYIDEHEYIQHNPTVPDGREGLRQKFSNPGKWFRKDKPKYKVDIRRAAAEDDLVWIHLRDMYYGELSALVDIFRLRDGKIVEHWDVIQKIPDESANQTPMFNSEKSDFKEECKFIRNN